MSFSNSEISPSLLIFKNRKIRKTNIKIIFERNGNLFTNQDLSKVPHN